MAAKRKKTASKRRVVRKASVKARRKAQARKRVAKAAPAKAPVMAPAAPMTQEPVRREPGTGMGGTGGMGGADDYSAGPLWSNSEDEEG